MNLALSPDAMESPLFARLVVAGVSLFFFGVVAYVTNNLVVLALALPPMVILELFVVRTR